MIDGYMIGAKYHILFLELYDPLKLALLNSLH